MEDRTRIFFSMSRGLARSLFILLAVGGSWNCCDCFPVHPPWIGLPPATALGFQPSCLLQGSATSAVHRSRGFAPTLRRRAEFRQGPMPRARGDFLARWAAKASRDGGDDAGSEGEKTRLLPDNGSEESSSVDDAQQGGGDAASSWLASSWAPIVMLNFVAMLWGTQHSIIKMAVDSAIDSDAGASSPSLLNLARFAIATMVFLPLSPGLWMPRSATADGAEGSSSASSAASDGDVESPRAEQELDGFAHGAEREEIGSVSIGKWFDDVLNGPAGVWIAGGEMGMWMFLGYAFQAVGLMDTTASRSAFLLYLNVKLVPIFAWVLFGAKIEGRTWLSAAIAVVGTCLLGYDGGTPPNIGDAWCIAAAAASAMFILRLGAYTNRFEASELNATSMVSTTALCLGWVVATDHPGSLDDMLLKGNTQVAAALYLGLVTTALTNFLQTIGQRYVRPEKAAIIYSIDPVWGAGFAYLLLGETIAEQGLAGCALLMLATAISMSAPGQSEEGDVGAEAEC